MPQTSKSHQPSVPVHVQGRAEGSTEKGFESVDAGRTLCTTPVGDSTYKIPRYPSLMETWDDCRVWRFWSFGSGISAVGTIWLDERKLQLCWPFILAFCRTTADKLADV